MDVAGEYMSKHFTNPYTDDYGKPKAAHKGRSLSFDDAPAELGSDHYYVRPLLLKETQYVEERRDWRTGKRIDVAYQLWDCSVETVRGRGIPLPVVVYHDNLKQLFKRGLGDTFLVEADHHEVDGQPVLSVAGVWRGAYWEQGSLC